MAPGYAIISSNETVYKKAKKQQKVTQAQSALTHGTETKRSTSQTPYNKAALMQCFNNNLKSEISANFAPQNEANASDL